MCNLEQRGQSCGPDNFGLSMGGHEIMPLLQIALSLIVVGVLLWLVNTYIPMARSIKSILNAVVVIVVVVWLLNIFGLLSSLPNFRITRG
jgi:hypothetical protein